MPGTLNPLRALIAGRGVVLLGAVGATAPTLAALTTFVADSTTFPTGFAPFGDTDPEELPGFEQEGGEVEMRDTWWTPNARSVQTASAARSYTVNGVQWDNDTMSLYEGGGDASGTGIFWTPKVPVPTSASSLIVMYDTSNGRVTGIYNPKVTIRGADAITINRDNWATIPLRFTEENLPAAKGPRAYIGEGFGVSTP